MSTIKSSAEDLTLNADGSNEIKFQINAVEKASISSAGLLTSTTIDATALTGNLPAIDGSSLTGISAGITEADQWRLTTDFADSVTAISTNIERNDTSFEMIGSGMSESSGIFSFPSTGKWWVLFDFSYNGNNSDSWGQAFIDTSTNASTTISETVGGASIMVSSETTGSNQMGHCHTIIDVTDISNMKVRFRILQGNSLHNTRGNTNKNETTFTFIKLGQT
jgi:hypothetical protein